MFVGLVGATLLLLLSYSLPAGFQSWRSLDEIVFRQLNGWLGSKPGFWEAIWAWGNTRYIDLLVAIAMVISLVYPVAGFNGRQLQQAWWGFLALVLLLGPLRYGWHHALESLNIGGTSPSLVITPCVRLSELFPNVPLKDASYLSFPGDHASVYLTWTGFLLVNCTRSKGSLAIGCLSLIFVMPRLVAGAHWFSDIAVGSLLVVLPLMALGFCSPVAYRLACGLGWLAGPMLRTMSHWPWFRQQPFFRCQRQH
jgi:membrane-associated phospholipid phosphatase